MTRRYDQNNLPSADTLKANVGKKINLCMYGIEGTTTLTVSPKGKMFSTLSDNVIAKATIAWINSTGDVEFTSSLDWIELEELVIPFDVQFPDVYEHPVVVPVSGIDPFEKWPDLMDDEKYEYEYMGYHDSDYDWLVVFVTPEWNQEN